MTVTEASQVLKVSEAKIRRDIRAHRIPTIKIYGKENRHHIAGEQLAAKLRADGFEAHAQAVENHLATRVDPNEIQQ